MAKPEKHRESLALISPVKNCAYLNASIIARLIDLVSALTQLPVVGLEALLQAWQAEKTGTSITPVHSKVEAPCQRASQEDQGMPPANIFLLSRALPLGKAGPLP